MQSFRTLLIQLVVLTGLLLCVELALQLWFPFIDNQAVERKLSQDLPGLKSEITYRSGQYGLRSLQAVDDEKPEKQLRILCLGASTTEQTTQETRDTWCGILETELKARFGQQAERLQSMALGVGGYRALDNVVWLREHIDQLKPDIVITLIGINDLAWNGGKDYKYTGLEAEFSKRRKDPSSGLIRSCKKYSQLCRRILHIKQLIGTRLALSSGKIVEWHSDNLPKLRKQYRDYPEKDSVIRKPDPFDEFQDASRWLANYLKQRDIALIMLGQPVVWQKEMSGDVSDRLWFSISTPAGPVRASGEWLEKEMARYNTAQQNIAIKTGAYYRDLDALIPKTLDYYFDDCHFTDRGSRQVALSILPVLSKVIGERLE